MRSTRRPVSEEGPRPITVFLLDDHEIVRRGLRDLLEAEEDVEVIGEASTQEQAVGRVHALDLMWPCSTSGCRRATESRRAARSGHCIPARPA